MLFRTFSLSLRLFANMMAGHTLLQILSSFVIAFLNTNGVIMLLRYNTVFSCFFCYGFGSGYCFFTSICFHNIALYLC